MKEFSVSFFTDEKKWMRKSRKGKIVYRKENGGRVGGSRTWREIWKMWIINSVETNGSKYMDKGRAQKMSAL